MKPGSFVRPAGMVLLGLACVLRPGPAEARQGPPDGFRDFAELDLAELLLTEVSLASRAADTRATAPAAISVITHEDIQRSGAKRLYDIFRLVPGLDVFETSSYTAAVQARGFPSQYARQMLVLLDGRSVYTPQIGNVNWDEVPVFLDDIARIEIIRGPCTTLYGANAMNGVINIITFDPASAPAPSARLGLRGGNDGYRSGWASQAGGRAADGVAWRLTAGYEEARGYEDALPDSYANPKLTFRLGRGRPQAARVEVLGGFWGGDRETDGLGAHGARRSEDLFGQIRAHLPTAAGQLTVQYWYHDFDTMIDGGPNDLAEQDIELEGSFAAAGHRFVIGANLRRSRVEHARIGGGTPELSELGRVYATDTFTPRPALALHYGIMFEGRSFAEPYVAPRLNLGWKVSPAHHLRVSVAHAHRMPSFYEHGLAVEIPSAGPGQPGLVLEGNEGLDPEEGTAYEAGWWWQVVPGRAVLNLEPYWNEVHDLIDVPAEPEVIAGPDSTVSLLYRLANAHSSCARGVELDLVLEPAARVTTELTYTYQDMTDGHFMRLAPRHKASLLVRSRLPLRLEVQAFYRYTSHYRAASRFLSQADRPIDAYHRLDLRVARRLAGGKAELALSGQNLLEARHAESALAVIDRSVLLELRTRF